MSTHKNEFQEAIDRICGGSQEDILEFIKTYEHHIRLVVRRKLSAKMRSKFDSVDFVQMVWASFFTDPGQISQFKNREELLGYLARMARNKVADEGRRRCKYQKHNVNKERSLQDPEVSASARRKDTPSQFAMAQETFDTMMDEQSERNRRIVEMRMSGATFIEIGEQLGIDEGTARTVIRRLRRGVAYA